MVSPSTIFTEDTAQLAAEQSAAESSRLAQEEAARLAAEQEAARVAAEQAAQAEAERQAAAAAAAQQAQAEQESAAEEAARQAAEEQAAAEEAARQADEDQAAAERAADEAERDAAANGWYATNGQWISPETAQRALAAGIPPGGDVPGYLRCGSSCGEWPTSGERQSWMQGLDPVPPGYEQWLDPTYDPFADR